MPYTPSSDLSRELRRILEFHRLLGIEEYPRSASLDRFLAAGHPAGPGDSGRDRSSPPAPDDTVAAATLEELQGETKECNRCELHRTRARIIFGNGPEKAPLCIVSEKPRHTDEAMGTLFSGEPGKLLDRMLAAIDLSRDRVYLTSLVKCCPPARRNPRPDEIRSCLPILRRQIEIIAPKIICTMGPLAAQTLLDSKLSVFRLRGRFFPFHTGRREIPLIPTLHPFFLLKNPEMKKASWQDLQMIRKKLGEQNSED